MHLFYFEFISKVQFWSFKTEVENFQIVFSVYPTVHPTFCYFAMVIFKKGQIEQNKQKM